MAARKKREPSGSSTKRKPTKASRASKSGAAKRKRGPGPRSKAVRENLQEQVFDLRLEGWTVDEVCAELGMSSKTVVAYERAELERRAAENAERREFDRDVSIARYERIFRKGMELADKSHKPFMQPLIRGLDSAAKAQERIDKIKGLDAPTKIDHGLEALFDSFAPVDADKPVYPSDVPESNPEGT